ncbi:hypothetical protein ACFL6I_23440 [candidate division KSB1 bacterium]
MPESKNRALLWQFFKGQAFIKGIIIANILYWLCIYTYYYFVAIDLLQENIGFFSWWLAESSFLGWPLLLVLSFLGAVFSNVWEFVGP